MANDYSLPFLSDLQQQFSDDDVEQIWKNRAFPLIFTADFSSNWSAIRDPNGMLIAPSGARCRVEPQPHHLPGCQVRIQHGDTRRQEIVSYEAIIFAKVVHRMFLNERPKDCRDPIQAQRRRFINQFLKKLPSQWRTLIIMGDLHHYKEQDPQIPWFIKLDVYTTLADPNNIRLVTLRPSSDYNARIECALVEVDRASAPEYEALSYVWGAPGSTRNILLNGKLIPIRENFEAALRQLRRRDRPRTMWIDGICIDQSNVQERTDQVQRMDKTYRNAAGVVVWIGRESNTSARMFDKIENELEELKESKQLQDMLRSRHFLDFPFQPEEYCPQCDGVPHEIPSKLVGTYIPERVADRYTRAAREPTVTEQMWKNEQTDDIEDFIRLLTRPWWRRVWVLQEAILAKNITLYCGPRSIDWSLFQGILYTYVRQGKRSRILHTGGMTTEARRTRAQGFLLALANSTFAFFFLQSSLLATNQLQGPSMADLLSLTWNFDATDPRDKLFALIGLLPENSPERVLFKPDYTVSVKQLFIHVARTFLETSRRLDVLTKYYLITRLHTWVADSDIPLRGSEQTEMGTVKIDVSEVPHLSNLVGQEVYQPRLIFGCLGREATYDPSRTEDVSSLLFVHLSWDPTDAVHAIVSMSGAVSVQEHRAPKGFIARLSSEGVFFVIIESSDRLPLLNSPGVLRSWRERPTILPIPKNQKRMHMMLK